MNELRRICEFLTFFTTAWAIFLAPSSFIRLALYASSSFYQSATFTVISAVYEPDTDSLVNYWLTGSIDSKKERLIPHVSSRMSSTEDFSSYFPPGTKISVFYNPLMPRSFIQGESLRVIHDTENFWERERVARRRLIPLWLIPPFSTLALSYFLTLLEHFSLQKAD